MENQITMPEQTNPPVEIETPAAAIESPVTAPAPALTNPDTSSVAGLPLKDSAIAGLGPQACGGSQPATCAQSGPVIFVYAIGKLRVTASSQSVGREFEQANWITDPVGPRLDFIILSQPRNVYIAREMCWILQIDAGEVLGPENAVVDSFIDAYILKPRTNVELNEMIAALEPPQAGPPGPFNRNIVYSLVMGMQGPVAAADACNGLQLPLVATSHIESFRREEFILTIKSRAQVATTDQAAFLFDIMLQLGGNTGNSAEYRAVNFLVFKNFNVYKMLAAMYRYSTDTNNPYSVPGVYTFTRLTTMVDTTQTVRKIVDVVFHFQETNTGELVDWRCEVDVTGQFPFMIRQLSRCNTIS